MNHLKIVCCTCGGIFDLSSKQKRVNELETLMEGAAFWDDSVKAQTVINECKSLNEWLIPATKIKTSFEDVKAILPEAEELGDQELLDELKLQLAKVDKDLADLEVRRMLSGELDKLNCYLSINSGAGGTEACDWALMLSRMYQRWAAKKNWDVEIIDTVEGDVAGIKSITMHFKGPFAYGYAKSEKGVHRLVRISPFDSNGKRHTSFASVDVSPEIGDDITVELRTEDIRVDTYRASGAGGQHVNKTDSAVRMTHIPSGIVVSCQSQRSQIQNRESCMKMLRSKMYEMAVKEREAKLETISGHKEDNAFGSQIRNYVFQPYRLVKDTRTKVESGNVQAVMDGEIDEFVNAYLKEFSK